MMIVTAMLAMMVLPTSMNAQSLFGRMNDGQSRYATKNETAVYGMLGNGTKGTYTGYSAGVGNQGFGQDPQTAPLGSGVAMLIAAGAGYALLKSKKSK